MDISLWDTHPDNRPLKEPVYATTVSHLERALSQLRIPEAMWHNLIATSLGLGGFVASQESTSPLLIGINGAQGAGKSTTAALLATTLQHGYGLQSLSCSIDDFYLEHSVREHLALKVHPLFSTRGVPGTHDLKLLNQTLNQLFDAQSDQETLIPGFSKALDDRLPQSQWRRFKGRPDVIILEGWCVGSRPEPIEQLKYPINSLEAEEDPDGIWRMAVNEALARDYHDLFEQLKLLIFLKIPDFSKVYEWRSLQERKLREEIQDHDNTRILNDQGIKRFIMHYERITRWNLKSLPEIADLTLEIDANHCFQRAALKWL